MHVLEVTVCHLTKSGTNFRIKSPNSSQQILLHGQQVFLQHMFNSRTCTCTYNRASNCIKFSDQLSQLSDSISCMCIGLHHIRTLLYMYVCVKQVIAFFSSKLEKKGPSPYSSAFVLETIEEASKSWPGARLRVCVCVCACVRACVCECIGGLAKKE